MNSHVYKVNIGGELNAKISKSANKQIKVNINDSIDLFYQIEKNTVRLTTKTQCLEEKHKDSILLAVCQYMVPEKIGDPIVKRLLRKLAKY